MKKQYLITLIVAGAALVTACNSGDTRRNPGKTYVPDMTYSRAYDAYTKNDGVTKDSLVSQLPVHGTIARGQALPDHLTEADSVAYRSLTSPYVMGEAELAEGKRLYNIYCGICHGTALDGNGPLYASGKFAAMPANLKGEAYLNMPAGQMYYAIMYGKNMMGSYAAQLNHKQRWEVVAYIKQFQSENGGAPFTMGDAGKKPAATAVKDSTTALVNAAAQH
jgi:mono/diheme cytochrome c family protein